MVFEELYESEANSKKREEVLQQLEKIVKGWVEEETNKLGIDKESATIKIYTFGSYKLGVHSAGSDIDALCVAPSHISRNLFFENLLNILRKTEGITEINPIPEASVPIIKMKFWDVDIDLL